MNALVFLVLLVAPITRAEDKKVEYYDNIADESQSNENIFSSSLSKPIFNDGKPFYVERDPSTGILDFNTKKNVGQNDIPVEVKDINLNNRKPSLNDVNSIAPNIHDFLNLPVKYSSSKSVYPLISSSYSNLKYQGNNKLYVSNHKNYSTPGTSTVSPIHKYYTHITNPVKSSVPSAATFKVNDLIKSTTKMQATVPEKTTLKVVPSTQNTKKIGTTKTTIYPRSQSTTVASTSTPTTTLKYSSTVQHSPSIPSRNKYVDSSETRRKSTPVVASTTKLPSITTVKNMIKFVDDSLQVVPLEESNDLKKQIRPAATTYRPATTLAQIIEKATQAQTQTQKIAVSTTVQPKVTTQHPPEALLPSGFKPMPTEVAKNQTEKISFGRDPSTMSLSELFNSLTGSEDTSSEQNSIQYDTKTASSNNIEKKHQFTIEHKLPFYPPKPAQRQTTIPPKKQQNVSFPQNDYVEFDNEYNKDQYVRYEVQKPNSNMVKFNQVPMNNVVISPDQNSASFVLASSQNIANIGVGSSLGIKAPIIQDGDQFVGSAVNEFSQGPIKFGTVINEAPPNRPIAGSNGFINVAPQSQSNINFPSELGNSGAIVTGSIKLDHLPIALPHQQSTPQPSSVQNVVFPNSGSSESFESINTEHLEAPSPNRVVFEGSNDIYGKINDKNIMMPNIPSAQLTPPHKLNLMSKYNGQQRPFSRPPSPFRFDPQRQQQQKQGSNPQRIPGLPNILPQFRPNAKSGQGSQPYYKDGTGGTIHVPFPQYALNQYVKHQHYHPDVRIAGPKTGLPSQNVMTNYAPMRRSQTPPRYMNKLNLAPVNLPAPIASMHEGGFDSNRRMYRLPQSQISNDRSYTKQVPQFPPKRYPESYSSQNNNLGGGGYQDFELHKNPPPQLPTKSVEMETDPNNSSILEPVVTLQMIQSKKGNSKVTLPQTSEPVQTAQLLQSQQPQTMDVTDEKSPVYVVYPDTALNFPFQRETPTASNAIVQNIEESAVEVNNNHQLDQTSTIENYQNTPFSVVSHFEQEPLLKKTKNHKNNKSPFPYIMERPQHIGPGFLPNSQEKTKHISDSTSDEYNIGEEPMNLKSKIINDGPGMIIGAKLTRVTEKPIAIAYTPTIPHKQFTSTSNYFNNFQHPHHQYEKYQDKFSMPNYGGPVISEILDDKLVPNKEHYHQQPQEEYNREHYDFQAPFHASMNLGNEVTTVHQGWAVITPSPYSKGPESNKIDRLDLNLAESNEEPQIVETTTRKFDLNQFKPEYLSGFLPIHSAGSNTAPVVQPAPVIMTTTERASLSSTITSTLLVLNNDKSIEPEADKVIKKIEENKKKVEIDSLEAFFDQLTRDYDSEGDTSKENDSELKNFTTRTSESSSI